MSHTKVVIKSVDTLRDMRVELQSDACNTCVETPHDDAGAPLGDYDYESAARVDQASA